MNDVTTPFRRDDHDDIEATNLVPRIGPFTSRSSHPHLSLVTSAPVPTPPKVVPVVPPPPAAPVEKWQAYQAVGLAPLGHGHGRPAIASDLGKPSRASKGAAKLVVSGYRLMGISILTLIVFVLVGYVGTTVFYFFNHTWAVPAIVSPSDDKVVAAHNELATAQNLRDHFAADLHDAERAIAVEQQFQAEFTQAVEDDLAGRKEALGRVRALAGAAAGTRSHIHSTTAAYAKTFAARTQAEFESGLIDRNTMMNGNYQLAQMSSSNLSLAEKQVELEGQANDLARQTRALDALLAKQQGTGMSYDVLKIKRDFEASRLALAKASEQRDALTASLARQEEVLKGLHQSAYLRAIEDHATVALVPYGNLDNAKPGQALYACKVAMVWCHEVGTVVLVLPGEVPMRHPHSDSTMRGQMVEVRMTDPSGAQDEVLFAGKPLGF